jgi:hypothetical protein
MKKIVIILFFIVIGVLLYVSLTIRQEKNNQIEIPLSPTTYNPQLTTYNPQPITKFEDIEFNNQTYRAYYLSVNPLSIKIIPNYQEKLSAKELINANSCRFAVNGGFYTKENSHLGYLKIDGREYSPEITKSNLVNGYFSFLPDGTVSISNSYPDEASTVIQTGPLLSDKALSTADSDKQARRIVAAKNIDGESAILAITLKEDLYYGPTLKDLGQIVFSLSKPFKPESAINLDGGSASYFNNGEIELSEISPIGTLLCLQ